MDEFEFTRKLFGGFYKASVKGFYRSSNNLISDECMGDWMDDSFTGIYSLMEKFQNNPFSISIDETKKVMDDLIETDYKKNLDLCQVEYLQDSYNH